MHIPDPDPHAVQILGQVLGHALGERGDEGPIALLGREAHLGEDVVDLPLDGPQEYLRVHQARGPNDLLRHLGRAGQLPGAGRGGHAEHLGDPLQKLVELQRSVVEGGGEPKAVLHQLLLAHPIPPVHGADLGDGHVALVDDEQKILGKIVDQGIGRLPGAPAVEVAGVVFDAVAVADLLHHLHVVADPLLDALRLQGLVLSQKLIPPDLHVPFDVPHGGHELCLPRGVVGGGKDGRVVLVAQHLSGQGVDLGDALDLVSEEADPQGPPLVAHGEDIQRVAPDPEGAPLKVHVVSLELDVHQPPHDLLPADLHAGPQGQRELQILLGVAQGVDAGNRSHDDHVLALVQGAGGGVAQPVDLLVHRRGLLDVGIAGGDVGLRLVIIIIGNEILHSRVREKALELGAELGCQGLVMGQDQRGLLDLFYDLGHGVGFARAGDAQQHLEPVAPQDALAQLLYGLGLVALGGEGGNDGEHLNTRSLPCGIPERAGGCICGPRCGRGPDRRPGIPPCPCR